MKSCGYDLLVQVDERVLNKGLAALFYTGKLKVTGTYSYVQGVPEELRSFTEVKYKVRLKNEPYIDFLEKETVGIRLSVEANLNVLTGVDIEVDLDFGATATFKFDPENKSVTYDLTETKIYDIHIEDKLQFHQNVLERVNLIIKILLRHYLTEDIKTISLPLKLTSIGLNLPTIPDSKDNLLPVKLGNITILNNRLLTVAVNFFDSTGGSFEEVSDMTGGAEIFTAISYSTLQKIAKFWWDRTSIEKKKEFEGKLPINARRTLSKGMDLAAKLVTLGIVEPQTEIRKADLIYDCLVEVLDLPQFSFTGGNKVLINNLKLMASVKAHLETESHNIVKIDTSGPIPDIITPWEDDRVISEKDKKSSILHIAEVINLNIESAECIVSLDEQNRLVLKVIEADLELDFGEKWYQNFGENIMNKFLDFMETNIVSKIPPIVISPSLLLENVDVLGYSFNVERTEIVLNEDEISLNTNINIRELSDKSIPVPLYIGNKKSLKLHRFDCQVVEDIDFTHRAGYHGVYEAIKDGYKPCGECLRGYSV
ncbi:hypothetical protein [Pseudobacteroides cellulosolvens]|uniref:Uncharacterized protein n=1 Tax=Pseudobacteroides cellulosolvens ATCC 35603 = DSM 2933 TaxID=398512 RepID=A0A0L6JW46_9FIRM|nr:hypothetical protein [Pseudobacteroides cellulosolvens]KNY29949.1 hypothetical protein Bccel_5226 [Pseudobacteroides cellulosolvens ATCC 35603 = DSM 2933]